MGNYIKEQPRLTVKFLDGNNTSKVLFEVNNRDHMNVGEMFSDTYVTSLINQTIAEQNLPDNVLVLVSANFRKLG
jgi:hypothetical protein